MSPADGAAALMAESYVNEDDGGGHPARRHLPVVRDAVPVVAEIGSKGRPKRTGARARTWSADARRISSTRGSVAAASPSAPRARDASRRRSSDDRRTSTARSETSVSGAGRPNGETGRRQHECEGADERYDQRERQEERAQPIIADGLRENPSNLLRALPVNLKQDVATVVDGGVDPCL